MGITLTKDVERGIRYAVHAQPDLEVGGFARVEQLDTGLLITDIIIPPQIVGRASVAMADEIPGQNMTGFEWTMIELAKRGETLSDWNCWWHSHSTMPAFASGTDEETLEKFAEIVSPLWAIGLIANTHGEYHCWMHDVRPPWRTKQTKINIQMEEDTRDEPLFNSIMEMMKHVQPAPVPISRSGAIYSPGMWNGGIEVVWCDEHMNYNDQCPVKHVAPRNSACRHTPNCGGRGCFSKAERKRMHTNHRSTANLQDLGVSRRDLESFAVLEGIDDEDWDNTFDTRWERAFHSA